jgi:DNA-binding transcriptional MerR regulator
MRSSEASSQPGRFRRRSVRDASGLDFDPWGSRTLDRQCPRRRGNRHRGRDEIGEFARRSRLSPKALRLYDELGLLAPARVDNSSGYRFYDGGQLERARLVAALRQLQMPLAEIKAILELEPGVAAGAVAEYWAGAGRSLGWRGGGCVLLHLLEPGERGQRRAARVVPSRSRRSGPVARRRVSGAHPADRAGASRAVRPPRLWRRGRAVPAGTFPPTRSCRATCCGASRSMNRSPTRSGIRS